MLATLLTGPLTRKVDEPSAPAYTDRDDCGRELLSAISMTGYKNNHQFSFFLLSAIGSIPNSDPPPPLTKIPTSYVKMLMTNMM